MTKKHVTASLLASYLEKDPANSEFLEFARNSALARDSALARINVTKPYRPRRLKQDPASRMARKVTEIRSRDPEHMRKKAKYRKEYVRKNKDLLKKRGEFVRKQKKMMGWD